MEFLGHYMFLSVCGYATGIICLGLGILVLQANSKSKACRLAFLFNLFTAIWSFSYSTIYLVTIDPYGLWVNQTAAFGSMTLNSFLTHLVLVLVHREREKRKLIKFNYGMAGLLAILIFSTKLIVAGHTPKLDLPAYTVIGPLYFLVPVYLLFNLCYSLYELAKGCERENSFRKNQLKLFFWATAMGYAAGIPAFLLCFDIPVKPVTTPLVVLYPILLTYTIVKHRFFNIEKLVKNTVIFFLLFLLLLATVCMALFLIKELMSHVIHISDALARGIAIALAISLYGPVKNGLSQLTNRLLFQHVYDAEVIFRKLSEDMLHFIETGSTEMLASEVTRRIADILALDRIGFYLKVPNGFELKAKIGRLGGSHKFIHSTKSLILYFDRTRAHLINRHTSRELRTFSKTSKDNPVLRDLKEIKGRAAMDLAAMGGVAAFPIFVRNRLQAVLIIGRKKSDASWSDDEFMILKSFTGHFSLALASTEYAAKLRLSQEKLSNSFRDATAGALISGIHHEVSNPLHAMSMNLELLRAKIKHPLFIEYPREEIIRFMNRIFHRLTEDAQTIDPIICHLSNLANKKPLVISQGLNLYATTEKAVSHLLKEGSMGHVRVQLDIEKHLTLESDENALYEILVNLIRNAEQAINEQGEITISVSDHSHEMVIRIRDSGSGIPESQREKIFEPFFTTKRKNQSNGTKGTGMGLFVVKENMEALGGTISVESEVGVGTTFELCFPKLKPVLPTVSFPRKRESTNPGSPLKACGDDKNVKRKEHNFNDTIFEEATS